MNNQNQISLEIPQEVIDQATQKVQELKTLFAPYLQALTVGEKEGLFKMGDKSVAGVQKVKSYLETNPEFKPSYMDQAEFLKDEKVVSQLSPIVNMLAQLFSDASDTVTIAGSEALTASLLYYGNVREAASKGVTSAVPIYEDLKQRFTRGTYKKTNKPL